MGSRIRAVRSTGRLEVKKSVFGRSNCLNVIIVQLPEESKWINSVAVNYLTKAIMENKLDPGGRGGAFL